MSYYSTKKKIKRWFWTILILLAVGAFCVWKYVGFDKVMETRDRLSSAFSRDGVADTVPSAEKNDTVYVDRHMYSDSVQLVREGSHRYASITIGGARVGKAMLDSGCTIGFCGNAADYEFMRQYRYIKKTGTATVHIVSGDTIETVTATGYDVEVFGRRFDSLECQFVMSADAPSLIGQGVLNTLGRYTIDPRTDMLYIE